MRKILNLLTCIALMGTFIGCDNGSSSPSLENAKIPTTLLSSLPAINLSTDITPNVQANILMNENNPIAEDEAPFNPISSYDTANNPLLFATWVRELFAYDLKDITTNTVIEIDGINEGRYKIFTDTYGKEFSDDLKAIIDENTLGTIKVVPDTNNNLNGKVFLKANVAFPGKETNGKSDALDGYFMANKTNEGTTYEWTMDNIGYYKIHVSNDEIITTVEEDKEYSFVTLARTDNAVKYIKHNMNNSTAGTVSRIIYNGPEGKAFQKEPARVYGTTDNILKEYAESKNNEGTEYTYYDWSKNQTEGFTNTVYETNKVTVYDIYVDKKSEKTLSENSDLCNTLNSILNDMTKNTNPTSTIKDSDREDFISSIEKELGIK